MSEATESLDYEAAWLIAEQRTRDAQAQVDLLLAQNTRLREALLIHGEHRPSCATTRRAGRPCTCGLKTVIDECFCL